MVLLRLDIPHLTPTMGAAVLKFRATQGWGKPHGDTPDRVLLVVSGILGKLHVDGVFPPTTCFVQVDVQAQAVRWSEDMFISLHTVESVTTERTSSKLNLFSRSKLVRLSSAVSNRLSSIHRSSSSGSTQNNEAISAFAPQLLCITFSDRGGIQRILKLMIPDSRKVVAWRHGLNRLLNAIPRTIPPPHSRWARSCMTATSKRGASGSLHRLELRGLLIYANASSLSGDTIDEALRSVDEDLERLHLPQWLTASNVDRQQQLLNARQVTGLLLRLSTSSSALVALFNRYAAGEDMSLREWLSFHRAEQLGACVIGGQATPSEADAPNEAEEAWARGSFELMVERVSTEQRAVEGLNSQLFALHILSPQNDAVGPARSEPTSAEGLDDPFAHYWTAASHNSCTVVALEFTLLALCTLNRRCLHRFPSHCALCTASPLTAADIVGDQITGTSSANAYRRQLLQVWRAPHEMFAPSSSWR